MNNKSSVSQSLQKELFEYQESEQDASFLSWWYRLTAPPYPSKDASFTERERARRGRLLSVFILLITVIVLLAAPSALITKNFPMLSSLSSALVFNVITLWFNRRGQIVVAGLLTVLPMILGFTLGLAMAPGGLTIDSVRTFDLLIATELFTVSLFPPKIVFLTATGNSVLIWVVLTFAPAGADLKPLLMLNRYGVVLLPIILQFVVALPAYLLVSSAQKALVRADAVSLLERGMLEQAGVIAEQARELMEQKRQIDYGIQQILQTHIQAAKGNLSARAPRTQDNVLWQIAISLNTLLARLQRSRQVEMDFMQLQLANREIMRLAQALYKSRLEERVHPSLQNEMYHDQLLAELHALVRSRR